MQPSPANKPFAINKIIALDLILLAVVFLTFLPAVFNDFTTYDDPEYVTANPHVQSGLTRESLVWAFCGKSAHWDPLARISHILDSQIFGMKAWGHHLTSVLLHTLNALLAFLLIRKLTGMVNRSFVVALLFGLHPLRVESVAWVAERKDVLSVFFWLLAVLAYTNYAQERAPTPGGRKVFYALSLVMFALGLMSKSTVVTLPFLLLLLDFWPLARMRTISPLRLALEKIPFFMLAAIMTVIAYFAQYKGSAMVTSLSLGDRVSNALISYCRYPAKMFWPAKLCALYPLSPGWPPILVTGAALLLVAVTIFVVSRIKEQPYLAIGWFWYLGTLMPVIGLVQAGNQAMADRYTYFPSLGILIAVVWWIADASKSWRNRNVLLAAATAVLACACAAMTERQIRFWHSTEAMFSREVAVTKNNTLAFVGLGTCLAARNDPAGATELYRRAIEVSPNYYEARENLALALLDTGKSDDALTEFRAAIKCRPGVTEGYINLSAALAHNGDLAEAATTLQSAAAIDPSDATVRANLGSVFSRQKDFAAAANQFKLAADSQPENAQFHYDLAAALQASHRPEEAIKEFRAALKLAPDNARIHNDLGTALANQGAIDAAIQEFQTAVKLDRNYSVAAANLSKALNVKAKSKPAHN